MFKYSKQNCDHLTVLLHTDPSMQRQKLKPVHTIDERIEVLSSIKFIDDVIVYRTEEELYELLSSGNYDVRFLGDDYKTKSYTASDLDIEVLFINRDHGYSTTKLKQQICESMGDIL